MPDLTEKERRLLAHALLAMGILQMAPITALELGRKLGVADLMEAESKRLAEAAEAAVFPP
jgi:hypothetical protein